MDAAGLLDLAMATAAALPSVTHEHPFGPEYEVFKVAGKVFLLATEAPGEAVVTVKCEPEHATALRQAYDDVVPARYLDKRHWVSVRAGGAVPPELVDELVRTSYELVVEGLPRARRPGAGRSPGAPAGA
ncbi:MmcQ/YjbR family DNA-binding protein [Geodermatophilus sp. SYSU D01119]